MAIYANETWKSNNNLAHKLDVFHHRCLLEILWQDHVTNDDVRQRSGQRKLSEIVKERPLKMLGDILRMPEERLQKYHWSGHLLEAKEKGADQSPPGEEQDLQDMGISWEDSKTIATDRVKWRDVVAQCSNQDWRN